MKIKAIVLIAGSATLALAGSPTLRPVALTQNDGKFGPGLGNGIVFSQFSADPSALVPIPSAPVINANGDLITLATIQGTGIAASNNAGVWAYRDGQLTMLAQRGAQIPGAPAGLTYSKFGSGNAIPGHAAFGGFIPTISNSGAVAFVAVAQGAGVSATAKNDDVLMSDRDGSLSMIMREGIAIPGHPADTMTTPAGMFNFELSLSDDGSFAAYTFTRTSRSLITNASGNLESKFYLGDTLPAPHNASNWSFGWWEPAITSDGNIYHKTWNSSGAAVGFATAIWSANSQNPVLTGGEIGADLGDMANRFGLNSTGGVSMIDPGGDVGEGSKIVTTAQFGIPFPIAQQGQLAPGTTSSFGALDLSKHAVAENNTTIFLSPLSHDAQTNSTNDWGIWTNRQGVTVSFEIREGDPAPDVAGASIGNFTQLYINASGQIAFHATLTDNTHGVWVQDDTGTFKLIARTFTLLDILADGSDNRLITDIFAVGSSANAYGTSSGRAVPLNDNGDIALRIEFSDGSEGIFTTAADINNCPADLDNNGLLNFFDVSAFLDAYANNDLLVDFTDDQIIDFFDVAEFLDLYTAGCP